MYTSAMWLVNGWVTKATWKDLITQKEYVDQ